MIRACVLRCQQPGPFVLSLSKHERAVSSAPSAPFDYAQDRLRQAHPPKLGIKGERRGGPCRGTKVVNSVWFRLCRSAFLVSALLARCASAEDVRIVTRDHPRYREVLQGVRDGMREASSGLALSTEFLKEKPEGAREHAAAPARLMLAIGSEAYSLALREQSPLPLVFSMVLQPAVPAAEQGGRRVAGVLALPEPHLLWSTLRLVQPKAERVGTLFLSPGIRDYVAALQREAQSQALELVALEVKDKADFSASLENLLTRQPQALLLLPDFGLWNEAAVRHTLLRAFRAGIPCIGFSQGQVKAGALWGLGLSPRNIGRQSARLALDLLEGKTPPPLTYAEGSERYLNLVTSRALGLSLPKAVLDSMDAVLDDERP